MDHNWHKSSYSGSTNPNCVECRAEGGVVQVRDIQHRQMGHLSVPAGEWRAFLAGIEWF